MSRAGVFETVVGLIVILVAGFFFAYAYGLSGNKIGGGEYRLDAIANDPESNPSLCDR